MPNSVNFKVILTDAISGGVRSITSAFKKLSGDIKGTTGQLDKLGSVCARLKMPDWSAQISLIGQYSQAISDTVSPSVSFGQSIANLSSITGIAGGDLEQLTEKARQFGRQSGLGADTAARAYTILASQIQVSKIGIEGLNTLEEQSIVLAEASGMTIDDAATSMASTINQFGLEAEDAARVVNVLAAGSKYGAAEIKDLAESFKAVGSTSSAMGLSVEQTTGALEALSKVGITGAEAGTQLRNVLLSLNTKMGVDLSVTSLQDALGALKPMLADTGELTKIFGRESVTAAIGLIQNAEAVGELTAQVTGSSVATEQAAIRTETTAHQIEVMRAKVDDLKIGIGNFLGGFAPLAVLASENAVNVAALCQVMSALGGTIPKVVLAIQALAKSTLAQKAATLAANVASKAFAAVQALVNAVLTANPMGIVIMAMAALAAGIAYAYEHSEKFREACDKAWGAVKALASAVFGTLVKAFEKATGAIKKAWEWLKKFLGIGKGEEKGVAESVDESTAALKENAEAAEASSVALGLLGNQFNETGGDANGMSAAVKNAMAAFKSMDEDLKAIASTNQILGRSEDTLGDQISHVENLIMQSVSALGSESAVVKALTDRYNELKAAKRAQAMPYKLERPKDDLQLPQTVTPAHSAGLQGPKPGEGVEKEVARIREMQARLSELRSRLDLPGLSDESRKAIKKEMSALKQMLGMHESVASKLSSGWSAAKGFAGGLTSLTSALEGNGTVWEKLSSVVDGVIQMFQSMPAIIQMITGVTNGLTMSQDAQAAATQALAAKQSQAAATEIGSNAAVAASERTKATASVTAAAGETMSAHASIPFVGIGIAVGLIALMIAAMASLPKFAKGGIAFGPALGLFGEYPGASHNPEVVAPLDRLRSLIGGSQAGSAGKVEFRIEGRTLVGILNRENNISRRS